MLATLVGLPGVWTIWKKHRELYLEDSRCEDAYPMLVIGLAYVFWTSHSEIFSVNQSSTVFGSNADFL